MNEKGFEKALKKLYYQKYGRFIFVWEKFKRDSRNYQNIDAESEMLREESVLQCWQLSTLFLSVILYKYDYKSLWV